MESCSALLREHATIVAQTFKAHLRGFRVGRALTASHRQQHRERLDAHRDFLHAKLLMRISMGEIILTKAGPVRPKFPIDRIHYREEMAALRTFPHGCVNAP
jgi:hypothetical protein